jgi:tetratricopeptide (TPR) repeat protein
MINAVLRQLCTALPQAVLKTKVRGVVEAQLIVDAGRHLDAGEFGAALSLLEPFAKSGTASASLLCLLGQALARAGRLTDAQLTLERALAQEDTPELRAALGNVLRLAGDDAGAEAQYRIALDLDQGQAAVWYNLGLILQRRAAYDEAAISVRRALAEAPMFTEALRAYARLAALTPGLWDGVREACERALKIQASFAVAWEILGYVRLKQNFDAAGAVEAFDRALAAGGDGANLHGNLGIALQDVGRIPAAIEAYDRAIARDANNPLYRFHRSLALLLTGRFTEAWPDYELRLLDEAAPQRRFAIPKWFGDAPPKGRLLVSAEQGLGDQIMFASCIPDLEATGVPLLIECHPQLEKIFCRSFPQALVRAGTQFEDPSWTARYPDLSCYVPCGSLPGIFRRTAADFPQRVGYLKADPEKVISWRERLAKIGSGLTVGISWRGGTEKSRRALRSPDTRDLANLLQEPSAEWISLQYDVAPGEIGALEDLSGRRIHHWPDAIADYDETAALLSGLDLIVSVCTSVVHLGGALGCKVWVMAPFTPEWRYGLNEGGMHWYPHVRVIKQKSPNAWPELIQRVHNELAALQVGS